MIVKHPDFRVTQQPNRDADGLFWFLIDRNQDRTVGKLSSDIFSEWLTLTANLTVTHSLVNIGKVIVYNSTTKKLQYRTNAEHIDDIWPSNHDNYIPALNATTGVLRDTILYSDVTTGNISIDNTHKFIFGTNGLDIYHNNTDGYLDNKIGNLYLRAGTTNGIKIDTSGKLFFPVDNHQTTASTKYLTYDTNFEVKYRSNAELLSDISAVPTSRTLTLNQGGGIVISNTGVAQDLSANRSWMIGHEDTSSQASVNNTHGYAIQDITLDTYGHITALSSVDFDGLYIHRVGDAGIGFLYFSNNQGFDVDLTGGTDILNIGTANADTINIGWSGAIVNIQGTLLYQQVANLQVQDKLITLNKGGAVASGTATGFEIEEDGAITGYFTTDGTREGWIFRAPAIAYESILKSSNLNAPRTYQFKDASGTLALAEDYVVGSNLLPIATVEGSILRAGSDPYTAAWSTVTIPNTTTAYQLLVSTATNTIGELTVGSTGQYLAGATGAVPVWTTFPTYDNYVSWSFAVDGTTKDAITTGGILNFKSGTGLTITRSLLNELTFTNNITQYTDEIAQDAIGSILVDTASVAFVYTDTTPSIVANVLPAGVDHNSLLNYSANKHIDHTGVTLTFTQGAGITVTNTGAGLDISSSRSWTIASTITQYTDALTRAAISLTTIGTSGNATYTSATGVFNIPNYTYTHSAKAWTDKTALAGAYVVSNLTIDTTGHPTDWVTRQLTPSDIGLTQGALLLPTGTEGQMLYNNAGVWTAFGGLLWDDTNTRLSIGSATSFDRLNIYGGGIAIQKITNGTTAAPSEEAALKYTSTILKDTGMYFYNSYTSNAAAFLGFKVVNAAGTTIDTLRLSPDGKVGVNITNPYSRFSLLGSSVMSESFGMFTSDYTSTTGSWVAIRFGANTGDTNGDIQIYNQGNVAYGSLALNRLGGTISIGGAPVTDAKLLISSSNNAGTLNNVLRFKDTDTATQADQFMGRIEFETADTSFPGIKGYVGVKATSTASYGRMVFATGSTGATPTEWMAIQPTGLIDIVNNVGIGESIAETPVTLGVTRTFGNNTACYGILNTVTSTDEALSANRISYGIRNIVYANNTDATYTKSVYGFGTTIYNGITSGATSNLTNIYGSRSVVTNRAVGTVTTMVGSYFNTVNSLADSVTTNMYGTYNKSDVDEGSVPSVYLNYNWLEVDAGTVNVAYGVYNRLDRDAGTLTTAYGIYNSFEGTIASKIGFYNASAVTLDFATLNTQPLTIGHWDGSTATNRISIATTGIISLLNDTIVGSGGAGIDYTLTFDGETNNGILQWMEDEDNFYFQDQVAIGLADAGAYMLNVYGTGYFSGEITAPSVNLVTGASVGYTWQCTNVDGSGEWAIVTGLVYKGQLNGTTGTPVSSATALVDGTGTTGDFYACSTAGTYDYGNGNIILVVGDQLYYNGTTWEKIPGAGSYILPIATDAVLGGVMIGSGISIDEYGVISVSTAYEPANAVSTHAALKTGIHGLINASSYDITVTATTSIGGVNTGDQDLSGYGLKSGKLNQFAITSSSELFSVLSDASGTGFVAYTTSPTFVTPILGTPTSGNLANCDFPILNQDTTGNASTATKLATAVAIYGNNFDGSAALTQVITSVYGGTGNGFTKFTGPTTSEKIFTLPNSDAVILTDYADVTVAQGGTGLSTVAANSYLKGNDTAALVPRTYSEVKTDLSLNNVENTALSTWAGTTNITILGTIATGSWNATVIPDGKIASALTGKTYNGLTLTAATDGFSIAGGTNSKTLSVPDNGSVSGTNTGDQTLSQLNGAPNDAAYILQTASASLTSAQILSVLATGIVKNTTNTGVLSIAVAADFPTLNQNTTGTATNATNVGVTNDTTTNSTMYPLWVTANTGNLPIKVSSTKLYFNPSTGTLNSTKYVGEWNGSIIASTYGGTGNGFTKFTGPDATEKTFTLPNSSAIILTDYTDVTVAQGGTGLSTVAVDSYLKGNGTNPLVPRTYAQVLTDLGLAQGGLLLPTGTEGQTLYNNAGVWTALSGMRWDDTNNRLDLNIGTTTDASSINLGTYSTSGEGGGVLWKPNYSGYTKISAAIRQVAEGNYFRSGIAFYTGNSSNNSTNAVEVMRISMNGKLGLWNIAPAELLTLGTAGTTAGTLSLAGASSGKAIIVVSAIAGTPTLTLPTTTGTLALVSNIPAQVYPGAGIAVSTGSAWGTSLLDNSADWNTAYNWGDHALVGYGLASALTTHAGLTTTAHGLGASAFHADAYFALAGHDHNGVYEPVLGNPGTSGYILSSSMAGVRSWIAQYSYTHPSKTWTDKTALTGAYVISNLTIDSLGHPTNWTTRQLTYSDISAASSTHGHGNILSTGAIGTVENLPIITGSGGVLQVGSFGTGAYTFAQGNDSRFHGVNDVNSNYSPLVAVQTMHKVWIGPVSGSATTPTWRILNKTDIPQLDQDTSGTAAKATTVALTDAGGVPGTYFLTMATNWSSGGLSVEPTKLYFTSSTGLLTSTKFAGEWTGTAIADAYISSAATWSAKQNALNATGGLSFVKANGTTISYDNNTYVTGTPWTTMGYVTGTPWTAMGYLTSQTSHADVVVDGDFTSEGIMLRGTSAGTYSILTNNSIAWNLAAPKADPVFTGSIGFDGTAGANISNFTIKKAGSVGASNVSYTFSHRANGEDFLLYGHDGSTIKNWFNIDSSADTNTFYGSSILSGTTNYSTGANLPSLRYLSFGALNGTQGNIYWNSSQMVYSSSNYHVFGDGTNVQFQSTATGFDVTGVIVASGTITGSEIYRGSSRKLKKNIQKYNGSALDLLHDIVISTYNLKSDESFGIGFIAEDTHKWLSGEDQKQHSFGNHLGILTKAVQELQEEITILKMEILKHGGR